MDEFKDRFKALRKELNLSQKDMADKIRIGRSAISLYEIGQNVPSDAVISLICREFNVNELWLRYGDGEMFVEKNPDEEIEAFMLSVLRGQSDSFKHRFAKVISTMTEEEWDLLERKIKELQEP